MEKILLAIVLYTKKIEKIKKISQKFPIMILYPKYIYDKFLTFFEIFFCFIPNIYTQYDFVQSQNFYLFFSNICFWTVFSLFYFLKQIYVVPGKVSKSLLLILIVFSQKVFPPKQKKKKILNPLQTLFLFQLQTFFFFQLFCC